MPHSTLPPVGVLVVSRRSDDAAAGNVRPHIPGRCVVGPVRNA
jgi:hypothetical protein